jgi:hypothetical protein
MRWQRAGDVGRRQQDAEIVGLGGVEAGGEMAARLPDGIPAPLDFGGFEAFGEFHGGCGVQVENRGFGGRCGRPGAKRRF